ncbi:MAG TPA: MFS transporter [Dermatophilaceae bacterium]|nr:MFS transporter [Dermatophilaceae bacterium]
MTTQALPPAAKQSGIFYGWWIVLVSVLLMATIFGTIVNAFSLFIKPVIGDIPSITIAMFTIAYTVITSIAIPFSPIVGNLLRRFDARWIVSVGVVLAALANLGLSMTSNVIWLYLMAGVQGIAITFATTLPISAMVTNWFYRHRGLALGLATAGSGLGGVIFVPLILNALLPSLGWRGTYLALGAVQIVLLLPLSLLVLRTRPEDKGLLPLGHEELLAAQAAAGTTVRPGLTQGQVLRSPAFWALGAALIFSGISVNGMISNFAPILGSLQSPTAIVGFILGSVGLFVMGAKFLAGWLYDRLSLILAIALISLANAAQFFFMLKPDSMVSAVMFNLLHGFGATMVTITPAYLAGKLFGDRDYAAVYGWVSTFALLGAAIAPIFGGFFYGSSKETSGLANAQSLVWAWLVMGLVGFVLYLVTVRLKPHWEPTDQPVGADPVAPAEVRH